MALRTTRWTADTCGCVLDFEWDDSQDENTRVHSYSKVIAPCPEHQALVDKPLYDQVLSENTRKNIVWDMIQKQLNLTNTDLEKYIWFFDKNRILQVSLLGVALTTPQKNKLQSDSDKQFGTGKVKVV